MQVQILKNIGHLVWQAVKDQRLRQCDAKSISRGAAGDYTFGIDKEAEDIVISSLLDTKLPLTIISEERGVIENGSEYFVIIDPIDGSKNAISGLPFYCLSIAVSKDTTIGGVFLAYVINLLTGDYFWAKRNHGFYFNDVAMTALKEDFFRVIAFEAQMPARDLKDFYVLLAEARRLRCLGAAALDLAYTAYGAISLFVSPPLRSLDFAGGYLLVKEAGGVVTDLQGNDLANHKLELTARASILASGSELLHKKALRLLQKIDL